MKSGYDDLITVWAEFVFAFWRLPSGLDPLELSILCCIAARQRLGGLPTVGLVLSEHSRHSSITVRKRIEALEEAGLVLVGGDYGDARRKRIGLTDAGEALLSRINAEIVEHRNRAVLPKLSA